MIYSTTISASERITLPLGMFLGQTMVVTNESATEPLAVDYWPEDEMIAPNESATFVHKTSEHLVLSGPFRGKPYTYRYWARVKPLKITKDFNRE